MYSGSVDVIQDQEQYMELNTERSTGQELESIESIEIQNVGIKLEEQIILKDVNISIKKGDKIALVGTSGCGKSTLMNVITGLLEPDHGEVMINGISIDCVSLPSLRNRIGYVIQDPLIFDDTVLNNITLWNQFVEKEKLEEAIFVSCTDEFLGDKKDGLETLLGDNGVALSGGQRQRIALARELYKKIDLLILDEATSNLDSKLEERIISGLFASSCTMIFIAHRLSTIKQCDNIYVLDRGEIIQSGNYAELLAKEDGLFLQH